MLTALHPLLLWGLALVAVPILIHLLLRQRPRPRPWGAMRWLLAAAQAAQRKWRLTNLLLLLLRCLAVALLALAVARPALAGLGGGDHLLLVVDRTASMGARGRDPGPLAAARAALAQDPPPYRRVSLVAVGGRVEELVDGSRESAFEALARLEALPLPGGLDQAVADPGPLVERAAGADVLLVSDFQQDDGQALAALLAPHARRVARWAVGAPAGNALVAGFSDPADPTAGEPGELLVQVSGPAAGAALAIDDGPFLAAAAIVQGGALRLPLPPLPAGPHRIRVRLADPAGLAYDDLLELPLLVRGPLQAVCVGERTDWLAAALGADPAACQARRVAPPAFAGTPLPERGIVALRAAVADGPRLRDWVRGGGVLWASHPLLAADPALRDLLGPLTLRPGAAAGGRLASGERDLDEVFALVARDPAPAAVLPAGARVLLAAGTAPLVAALPAGSGWCVVELDDLAGDAAFQARGATPLWVQRMARRLAAQADRPLVLAAGTPVAERLRLTRGGEVVETASGRPLLAAPGAWRLASRDAVVLPDPVEGRLERPAPNGAVTDLARTLPEPAGRDWGAWLIAAALVVLLAEGLLAAWAGRTYGR